MTAFVLDCDGVWFEGTVVGLVWSGYLGGYSVGAVLPTSFRDLCKWAWV